MMEVEPVVVRVLDVPAGALLPELHDLLQAAFGWTDSHLHRFEADGVSYGMAGTDGPEDERDESAATLRALPDRFRYVYDYGDGWEHAVVVVGPGGDRPGVVAGEGACPPEDVGGPRGYAQFRQVMADPEPLTMTRPVPGRSAGTMASTSTPPTSLSARPPEWCPRRFGWCWGWRPMG